MSVPSEHDASAALACAASRRAPKACRWRRAFSNDRFKARCAFSTFCSKVPPPAHQENTAQLPLTRARFHTTTVQGFMRFTIIAEWHGKASHPDPRTACTAGPHTLQKLRRVTWLHRWCIPRFLLEIAPCPPQTVPIVCVHLLSQGYGRRARVEGIIKHMVLNHDA